MTIRPRIEVETEIKKTLGLVPSVFSLTPDEALGAEWELFKRWELGVTLIPNKFKGMLMLAVDSQTGSRYGALFHTEMARLFGATDDELAEAVQLAKHAAGWGMCAGGIRQGSELRDSDLAVVRRHLTKLR